MAQQINVDIKPGLFQPTLHFSQGDIGREFAIKIVTSDGFSVPVGATVDLVGTKPSGFGFTVPCTVSGNTVSFTSSNTDGEVFTDEHGIFPAELVIKNNGDVIGTANFFFSGEKNPHPAETIDGEAEQIIPELTLLVERVETAASSVLDMQVVANTLPAGSDATYSYDEETNTATFGIPKGADGSLASGVLAPTYSSSATYAVGDYVYYSGNLYRCITAITTAESWTASHWTQAAIATDVSALKEDIAHITPEMTTFVNPQRVSSDSVNILWEINPAKESYIPQGSSTGNVVSNQYTSTYLVTDFIEVEPSTAYCTKLFGVTSSSVYSLAEYDSSKSFLGVTNYPETFTTKASTKYIRITYDGANINTVYGTGCAVIQKGSTQPSSYIPPVLTPITLKDSDYIEHGAEDSVTPEMATFVTPMEFDTTGNLATEENNTEHGYIPANSQTGNVTSNQYTTDYCVTDYIEVEAGSTYAVRTFDGNVYTISQYKGDKTHISTTGNYPVPATGGTYTVGNDCKYIRVCLSGNSSMPPIGTGILVVIKGSTIPPQYIAPSYIPLRLIGSDYVENSWLDTIINDKIDERFSSNIKLELPDHYDLVAGEPFELFWKGVVNAVHYEDYFVDVICDIGRNGHRKLHIYPQAANVGIHTMTVLLYDNNKNKLDEANVVLNVVEKAASPASEKIVMYVGDSLTINGYVPDEFCRRLVGSGGAPVGDGLTNIAFIGDSLSVNNRVPYVGFGGWTWSSYNASMISSDYMWITANAHGKTEADQHSIYTDSNGSKWKLETVETNRIKIIRVSGSALLPSTGTLTWYSGGSDTGNIVYTASEQAAGNPFWDANTSSISFSNFVTSQGKTSLDYVYVLLGWNNSSATESTIKSNVRTFLNNVLADFPNCKIVILGLEIPAQDGLGYNYGQNAGVLSSYQKSMQHVFNLNKWYYEITQENAYSGNVSFVNIAGQFDTEYNMQTMSTRVNTRNETTVEMQDNGVHPAESGYYQIADACYRDFIAKLNA